MYNNLGASTTNATIRTDDGLTTAQIWDYLCKRSGETGDYFASAETSVDDPSGPDGIVVTKSETSAGRGHKVNFRNSSGYYGEGKRGESLFTAVADFEKNNFSEYFAYVNAYRNATAANEFTTEDNALRQEIENGDPQKLGAWLARLKTETIDMRIRDLSHSSSQFTANSKGINGLLSSDILDVNNMMMVAGQLSTLGGQPARVGMIGKQPVYKWTFGPVTEVTTSLKVSSDYQTLLRQSSTGIDYLLKGEVATLDDQIVRPYKVVNHDGNGPIGSARMPMGVLSQAITGGTAPVSIYLGGADNATNDTTKLYAKHFLGYAYTWLSGVSGEYLTTNNFAGGTAFEAEKYLMVVNPPNPGGTLVANGVGYYAYTGTTSGAGTTPDSGNTGNAIHCKRRLFSSLGTTTVAQAGVGTSDFFAGTTLGTSTGALTNIAFGAGSSWQIAYAHPVGAMVYQCNNKGVPLAFTPVYGAGGVLRPYGMHKAKRDMESEEGGFMKRTYIRSYFGTQLRKDRNDRTPSVGIVCHAVKLPHHVLPVVTA